MKVCNRLFRRTIGTLIVLTAALTAPFAGCTKVDDSLGSNFIPDNQDMVFGIKPFSNRADRPFVATRLYQTDSIVSSNLSYGYMGTMQNDTFGVRTAGFLSQYLPIAALDEEGFGYRPIFDSLCLLLSVSDHAGDTLVPIRYNVYEVASNGYLDGEEGVDTTFYINFDPTPFLDPEPVFTFTYPDGEGSGPSTRIVRMEVTDKGMELVRRLMLLEGAYKDDIQIYEDDEKWVDCFKGIYIAPQQPAVEGGNLSALQLSSSGLALYTRNRNRIDPSLIQDTLTNIYYFYISSAEYGNVSVNTVRHDYSGSMIDIADADPENPDRPEVATGYVEGMGGVVTELTFTDEFFSQLYAIYRDMATESGIPFRSMAISQAMLYVYLPESLYDWNAIDAATITPWLDASMERLGLYSDYGTVTAIADYYYYYEQIYSTTLAYDGYLNRSLGCYTMDISSHAQEVWNDYIAEREAAEAEGREIDLENVRKRSVYLAPEAYGLYDFPYTTVQGMASEQNQAPIKLDITYTLIK